jgi:hypothetical protein
VQAQRARATEIEGIAMSKHTRINTISPEEEAYLSDLCEDTKGVTRYGNRGRTTVMLETDMLSIVADLSRSQGKSVGEIIGQIVRSYFSELNGAISFDQRGMILWSDNLLNNLAFSYGGFWDSVKCGRIGITSFQPYDWSIGGIRPALITEKYKEIICRVNKEQLIGQRSNGYLTCNLEETDIEGFLCLYRPITKELHNFLTRADIVGSFI